MEAKKMIINLAGNICIICSLALLAVFILDWYNPFMDFLGHAKVLLYPLCICSIIISGCNLLQKEEYGRKRKRSRRQPHMENKRFRNFGNKK